MKVGLEDRKKLTILLVLMMVTVLIFVILRVVSPQAASGSAGVPGPRTAKANSDVIDPAVHVDELAQSEETAYTGTGRNIFRLEESQPIPQPIAPARTPSQPAPATQPAAPAAPPPPPPINLKFYGFANLPGQPKKIFLSDGDDVFVGGEGDIIDRHYKILRIGPASADIEDMQNNNRQTVPLV